MNFSRQVATMTREMMMMMFRLCMQSLKAWACRTGAWWKQALRHTHKDRCVFVCHTLCMQSGLEGHAEKGIVTMRQQGGKFSVRFSPRTAVCLVFGGGDSQADQTASGIAAACVLQDLIDEFWSLPSNRWWHCTERHNHTLLPPFFKNCLDHL